MNVLFLSSWYPTEKNPNFGVFVKEHARSVKQAGNQIVVIALVLRKNKKIFHFKKTDFRDENGVRTITLEIESVFKNFFYYLTSFQYIFLKRATKQLIKSGFRPELIHSNVVFSAGIMGSRLADRYHLPHVITEHWSRIDGILKKPLIRRQVINAYKKADKILPVSAFLQNKITTLLPQIDVNKFVTVGNIVDSETFIYRDKRTHQQQIHFCAIATWAYKKTPDKLPELFIEALSAFQKKSNKSIMLTMIGGGDRLDELKELCAKNELEASFTGYISKRQIAEHLQQADYFVHASTIETFGVVVAEALLSGTPVICSKVGALPELINDSNGILCNNDLKSWEAGLNALLNKIFDNKKIANDMKQRFGIESIGNKINAIYNSIAHN